jgi:putative addiction module component (TIGR02574 family)
MSVLLEEALKLPISERKKLADEIYESIEASDGSFHLTPEQEAELKRRIEYNQLHPDDVVPWQEVKERLRQKA